MLVYDNASRLTKANSGRYNNLVTRAYDAGGRMTSESLTVNGQTYPVASGYDAADRRTSITYPNGKIVAQTFTNRDQLSNVKYDAVNVSTFAYDLGGRKTTNTFGNSKVETRTYRADNRTNTIVTPTGITNFAYAWDVNKNKTQENDAALPTNVQDYTYDNEDRLTGFARNSGQTQAWTLSLVGDWSAFNDNGSAQTRTHNAVHELTGINANPLTYDAKGNLTTNSNGQTHTWDFENCMKTAVVGADTATYTYDAFRRRVTKNFQGTTTVFAYDGWRSVAEYENGAALTAPARLYVFGTYLDEALMMLAGSTKYYYHANDLYSVTALTNSAGTVVERYKYDPYGKVTVLDAAGTAKADPNNSEFGNSFLWQNQRKDKETGNAYFKNRYYSYALGRFISRWVDQEADVQFYQFQFAMPTVLTDPYGDPDFMSPPFGELRGARPGGGGLPLVEIFEWLGITGGTVVALKEAQKIKPIEWTPPVYDPTWVNDPKAPKEPGKAPQPKEPGQQPPKQGPDKVTDPISTQPRTESKPDTKVDVKGDGGECEPARPICCIYLGMVNDGKGKAREVVQKASMNCPKSMKCTECCLHFLLAMDAMNKAQQIALEGWQPPVYNLQYRTCNDGPCIEKERTWGGGRDATPSLDPSK